MLVFITSQIGGDDAVKTRENNNITGKKRDNNSSSDVNEGSASIGTSSDPIVKKQKINSEIKNTEKNIEKTERTTPTKSLNADSPRPMPSVVTLTNNDEAPRPDKKTCRHEVALPVSYTIDEVKGRPDPNAKRAKEYPFVLDPFQAKAVDALERGQSVLVSAHTSAGKTVVAEYAIAISLRDKQRVIYTSPIKALSNQKYRDLADEFEDVGLMTGDTTINPNASCLVMTTEILRSMIYRGSEVVREVAWVIYDEVHYMRDKERGVVWEESIVLLPDKVRFVFLSATIPNAREFAQWVSKIHQHPCHVVYTDYRPTPLQHYMFPLGGEGVFLVVDEKGQFRDDNFGKAMHSLGDSEEEDIERKLGLHGGNAKGNNKKSKKDGKKSKGNVAADLVRIVEMVMKRNYDPVICFSFSKRDCEAYANSLMRKNFDFNDSETKGAITQIFKAAVENLSEEDQKLPQVEKMLPLLKRGIGIHHGGLVPLIKEVVELLFQERLLKCLFATETFAMGINMPSKTVLFSNTRKWDGKEFRFIRPGEYIQMSGRAGRRGIDDRGIVIQIIDEKLEPDDAKAILQGGADPLESSFHLGYNMLLNMLRVEEIDIEFLVKMSLKQHQNEVRRPGLEEELKKLLAKRDEIDINHEAIVSTYFKIWKRYDDNCKKIASIISHPKYCVPFLQPGRFIYICDNENKRDGWAVLVRFKKLQTSSINGARDERERYLLEVVYKEVNIVESGNGNDEDVTEKKKMNRNSNSRVTLVQVNLTNIMQFSTLRLYVGKNYSKEHSRVALWETVEEVFRRFEKSNLEYNLPLLNPIEDMKVPDADGEFNNLLKEKRTDNKLLREHVLHDRPDKAMLLRQYEKKHGIIEKIKLQENEIKGTHSIEEMQDKIKCMKKVLRTLGLIDKTKDVVQLKGRVASSISTSCNELLVTELIFTNVFKGMNAGQIAALLSCFVYEDKSQFDDKEEHIRKELEQPFRLLKDSAKRVADAMNDANALEDMTVKDFIDQYNPGLMEIVYEWVNGKKFYEICKLNRKIYEGTIIRCMRRLEELITELQKATAVVGDDVLKEKFEQCSSKIKRDIIFAASLYL
eukprot:g7951.t1